MDQLIIDFDNLVSLTSQMEETQNELSEIQERLNEKQDTIVNASNYIKVKQELESLKADMTTKTEELDIITNEYNKAFDAVYSGIITNNWTTIHVNNCLRKTGPTIEHFKNRYESYGTLKSSRPTNEFEQMRTIYKRK